MSDKSLHHLMRVRVRSSMFKELQQIADKETEASGEYTSVSDLVRIALTNWIRTQRSVIQLHAKMNTSIQKKKR